MKLAIVATLLATASAFSVNKEFAKVRTRPKGGEVTPRMRRVEPIRWAALTPLIPPNLSHSARSLRCRILLLLIVMAVPRFECWDESTCLQGLVPTVGPSIFDCIELSLLVIVDLNDSFCLLMLSTMVS